MGEWVLKQKDLWSIVELLHIECLDSDGDSGLGSESRMAREVVDTTGREVRVL